MPLSFLGSLHLVKVLWLIFIYTIDLFIILWYTFYISFKKLKKIKECLKWKKSQCAH